jgi:hypothetical protein
MRIPFNIIRPEISHFKPFLFSVGYAVPFLRFDVRNGIKQVEFIIYLSLLV